MSDARPVSFTLRDLFGVVFLVSATLSQYGIGLLAVVSFGVPLGIIGREIVAHGESLLGWESDADLARWRGRIFFVLLCVVLSAFAILMHGWPDDATTWLYLIGACLWILLAFEVSSSWAIFSVAILFCTMMPPLCGMSFDWMLDECSGRVRTVFGPGLCFGRDGTNTAIIKQHLNLKPPRWDYLWCQPFGALTNAPHRAHEMRLVHGPDWRENLEKFPDIESRKQVLKALTDPDNLLRVHQVELLRALSTLEMPHDTKPDTWWKNNVEWFRPCYTPKLALQKAKELEESIRQNRWSWDRKTGRSDEFYLGNLERASKSLEYAELRSGTEREIDPKLKPPWPVWP